MCCIQLQHQLSSERLKQTVNILPIHKIKFDQRHPIFNHLRIQWHTDLHWPGCLHQVMNNVLNVPGIEPMYVI